MQKTKIEWCDYTCNPVKGLCQYNCAYCYAIRIYRRFKWNPAVKLDLTAFDGVETLKSGSRIFLGSTHDIFGHWVPDHWIETIIEKVKNNCSKTFIFLTKNPRRYSGFDFPKNAWIGYSTTGSIWHKWDERHEDNVKFVSIEPLAEPLNMRLNGSAQTIDFDWLIVGAETGNRKAKVIPETEWVNEIIDFASKADIKLFLKDNLKYYLKMQEFPEKRRC
jgi:protein gp37